jgi:hypothetical protein
LDHFCERLQRIDVLVTDRSAIIGRKKPLFQDQRLPLGWRHLSYLSREPHKETKIALFGLATFGEVLEQITIIIGWIIDSGLHKGRTPVMHGTQ